MLNLHVWYISKARFFTQTSNSLDTGAKGSLYLTFMSPNLRVIKSSDLPSVKLPDLIRAGGLHHYRATVSFRGHSLLSGSNYRSFSNFKNADVEL